MRSASPSTSRRTGWGLGLACLGLACGTPPLLPVPRMEITPQSLCEGETATSIRIDGSKSFRPETGSRDGLDFKWSFSSEPVEIRQGSESSRTMVVRFNADRPVEIRLEVVDPDGQRGNRARTLPLTLSTLRPCGAGCESPQVCVSDGEDAVCADDRSCLDDGECGCLSCRPDGAGTKRCLAR